LVVGMGERVQAGAAAVCVPGVGSAPPQLPHRSAPKTGRGRTFPELDCIRERLSVETLRRAESRAERLRVGADRALIANGALEEETYARALAAALGVGFETLNDVSRGDCPLSDDRLIAAAAAGLIATAFANGPAWIVAPRHLAARGLVELIAARPALARQFRLTTTAHLDRFVLRGAAAPLLRRAVRGLSEAWPHLSAAPRRLRSATAVATSAGLLATFALAPKATLLTGEALLALLFLAWLALRFAAALTPHSRPTPLPMQNDRDLPVYTIIAALYREARSVGDLLRAIARLNYPAEKLDVILAIEADDRDTAAAIAACGAALPVRVIVVPDGAPRTKPRALNVALPFARGHYTVVYDAEDRPEPDQLRRAVQAFATNDDGLACVQARLSIDNTDDGWLARMFTAEYAGQFDVFLDGLSAFDLPLPLGGSSNHFATAVLREVGGWDAWNVTEDADLGMRLARFGYRTAMIASTTHEEAPVRFSPWLRQRTRWFKGWMQTWTVHMREPLRLWRDLGPRGFCAFQLVVGGNVLAALVHPVFMTATFVAAIAGFPLWSTHEAAAVLAALYCTSLLTGYISSAVLGCIGLSRRGLSRSAWVLLLTPLHWLMLSLAAWRALYQFVTARYAWEKTEHGLAKHSRRAARLVESLVALEQEFAAMQTATTNQGDTRGQWRPRAQR
jgi:cellulose synthase/poly-beta-1,6-N-acetylglucosamine synthase-like glycosyltransferase